MMRLPVFLSSSLRILGATAVVAAAISPSHAWAKKVNIEWKAMKGATQYEIQVEQAGRNVAKKTFSDPAWSGELEPGFYVYQIRAYDKIKRPGQWTPYLPLVVLPPPPETTLPADGRKITHYNPNATTLLEWKPVPGATKYQVEVKLGPKVVYSQAVTGTQATLKALPAGEYEWNVSAWIEPVGRVPASFAGKKWPSKPSDTSEFRILQDKLEKPVPVSPIGIVEPVKDNKMTFKWKSVDGAEAYELELLPLAAKGRAVASAGSPGRSVKVIATDNRTEVTLSGEGQYTWRVRALANVGPAKVAEATGPQSTADFKIDRNAKYFEGSGYVALSTMLAPYTYKMISPSTGTMGQASSSAITFRGSAEYWFHPQWGASGAFETTQFQINSGSYSRMGFEALLKYRIKFSDAKYGWSLSPKAGLEERDYFEVFKGGTSVSLGAYGASVGVDLRRQFSDRFSVGGKLGYFKPLFLVSSEADGITGDASNRNISFGLQAFYWIGGHWGAGAGAYMERRSISFTRKGFSTSAAEQVFMDGTYFFGTLIYSFGR